MLICAHKMLVCVQKILIYVVTNYEFEGTFKNNFY